jgi:cytochrome c oxidase subunit IV
MDAAQALEPQGHPPAHTGPRHIPLSWLLAVWVALIVLTLTTVAVSRMDLGVFNTWIALGIATLKATLVLAIFMHMLYERPINFIVLCTALVFVFLFIGIVLMDVGFYHQDLIPDFQPSMQR